MRRLCNVRSFIAVCSAIVCVLVILPAAAREREPNAVYAARRAALTTKLSAPVVLFGFTGNEDSSPSYVFNQEENFYYLTGHNEEGAAILLLPSNAAEKGWKGPRDILFLPARNSEQERWHGPRMAPGDTAIAAQTGFEAVEDFKDLKSRVAALLTSYSEIYTLTPHQDDTGYPHARVWSEWLATVAPKAKLQDAASAIGAMRQIKSPGEIALLTKAIDLSIDAHLVAMGMTRPGLYEYQVAARMVETHGWGGCEGEAYAPIVGTG